MASFIGEVFSTTFVVGRCSKNRPEYRVHNYEANVRVHKVGDAWAGEASLASPYHSMMGSLLVPPISSQLGTAKNRPNGAKYLHTSSLEQLPWLKRVSRCRRPRTDRSHVGTSCFASFRVRCRVLRVPAIATMYRVGRHGHKTASRHKETRSRLPSPGMH